VHPPQAPVVELQDVAVGIGSTPILRAIDLRILPGEVVGLFGANGAGKTTLLRLLATQLRPTGGRATVLGVDIAGPDRLDVRRRIGVIGHTPALYSELTLRENLEFAATVMARDAGQVATALATVGLDAAADRRASVCSYGMQRRTEFARELMLEPDLLLLDEPHSALDVAASDLVAHLTDAVAGRGGSAVLVSHDRERVEKLASRTVELAGGTVA
jgi:heme ABC exporter ATP-binding subunit CcmA